MLRCAGCASPVSEFAARCPKCGRDADDAVVIPKRPPRAPPVGSIAPTNPYAFGAEPDRPEPEAPRPATPPPTVVYPVPAKPRASATTLATTVATVGSVLVLLAGGVAVGGAAGGRPEHAPPNGLGGRVLAGTPGRDATSVDPRDGRSRRIRVEGGTFAPLAAWPGRDGWLDADGRLATFSGGRLVLRPSVVQRFISPLSAPASSDPFADSGRSVVILSRAAMGTADATLVDLADGRRSDLGTVDSAGGDAQSRGAFVSVPAGDRPGAAAPTAPAEAGGGSAVEVHRVGSGAVQQPGRDIAVELRRISGPPFVIATSAQLDQDVGRLPTTPVRLGVYPSPTGGAVAVVLEPLGPIAGDVPIVVLNRQGELLAALGDWSGPMYGSQPEWSPGGYEIAYPTFTTTGAALAIATETGSLQVIPAPVAATTFGDCVWSPNSLAVVCETATSAGHRWLYATRNRNVLVAAPAPGPPLAWVVSLPRG